MRHGASRGMVGLRGTTLGMTRLLTPSPTIFLQRLYSLLKLLSFFFCSVFFLIEAYILALSTEAMIRFLSSDSNLIYSGHSVGPSWVKTFFTLPRQLTSVLIKVVCLCVSYW